MMLPSTPSTRPPAVAAFSIRLCVPVSSPSPPLTIIAAGLAGAGMTEGRVVDQHRGLHWRGDYVRPPPSPALLAIQGDVVEFQNDWRNTGRAVVCRVGNGRHPSLGLDAEGTVLLAMVGIDYLSGADIENAATLEAGRIVGNRAANHIHLGSAVDCAPLSAHSGGDGIGTGALLDAQCLVCRKSSSQ